MNQYCYMENGAHLNLPDFNQEFNFESKDSYIEEAIGWNYRNDMQLEQWWPELAEEVTYPTDYLAFEAEILQVLEDEIADAHDEWQITKLPSLHHLFTPHHE